jgi:DNA-binding MarR family transcriptional regulator
MRSPFAHIQPHGNASFYLSLLEFLLQAKQHITLIGDQLGLTSLQTIALMLIDEHHPRPMKSFCMLFHCDASNITGIIDGLEQKGMVSRQVDPKDRRIKTICLEAAGKRARQHVLEQLDANSGFLFDALTDSEAKQFMHIIEKLTAIKKLA